MPATPVAEKLTPAPSDTVTVPTALVPATPVAETFCWVTTVVEPGLPVPATPVRVVLTPDPSVTVTEPTDPVAVTE